MDPLEAISPIDGRYRKITKPLAEFYSEKALMKYRLTVAGEYLLHFLVNADGRGFSEQEKETIRGLYRHGIGIDSARIIKDIETKGYKDIKPTNHDVKATEYFMKDRIKGTSLEDRLETIRLGLTSEDDNNIAYALMLRDSLEQVVLPTANALCSKIEELSKEYKSIPMLARTHGQPASPTTVGKEFKVFSSRLRRQLGQLWDISILVKMNGATGNYNALHATYPQVNWREFSINFIESFNSIYSNRIKLKPNLITTQIEPHDTYAELFDNMRRLNTILVDFNQDMWRYISDDWFMQKPKEGEVGSSTMPHKINPIDFENSEKNLKIANLWFEFFSRDLPVSRLQRDLSDSTALRNFGVAFAYSLIGYTSSLKGLNKIAINEKKIKEELNAHPEVIAEAYQTILRREGLTKPYEMLAELTRGKKVTLDDMRNFIDTLNVSDTVKKELKAITPQNYTGLAELLVDKY